MIHEMKILQQYYKDVKSGTKTFELRKDDRNVQVGDIILLKEWTGTEYTGNELEVIVTYVLRNCREYGLAEGYCIIGIARMPNKEAEEKEPIKALMNFAIAVLAEVSECAKQEDAPLYEGDREVDCFVRLSDVEKTIDKYLKEIQLDSSCALSIEKHKTNADKIRSMNDEKLAEIIMCPAEFDNAEKHCRSVDVNNDTERNCIECCVKWLKSENK